MSTRPLRCLLLLACAAGLAALDAAPATVSRTGGSGAFDNAFVIAESIDGIEFTTEDPNAANRLQFKRGTYTVQYKEEADTDWLSGRGRQQAGNHDAALRFLAKAAAGSPYQWVREAAAVEAARCALALQRPADAVAQITALEKAFPRSLLLPTGLWLKGQGELANGDAAAATRTFTALKGLEKGWGPAAALLGARGEAAILRAQKKPAEAAAAVQALWGKTTAAADPTAWAELGTDLARDLVAIGRHDQAAGVWGRLAYGVADPALQSRAQLGWAEALAAAEGAQAAIAAFDHAAIAALLKDGDDHAAAAALALAGRLNDRIQKDAAVPAPDKLAYRTYLANLR